MKNAITYTVAVLIASVYLLGIAGVGIYTCHCGHANQPVLLADACDCGQPHKVAETCCKHKQPEKKKDDCCTIEYKSLQVDQNVVAVHFSFKNFTNSLFTFPSLPVTTLFSLYDETSYTSYRPPPPINDTSDILFRLAQLRL